jgi:hypothetical protein
MIIITDVLVKHMVGFNSFHLVDSGDSLKYNKMKMGHYFLCPFQSSP